jgi:hypothetical protein
LNQQKDCAQAGLPTTPFAHGININRVGHQLLGVRWQRAQLFSNMGTVWLRVAHGAAFLSITASFKALSNPVGISVSLAIEPTNPTEIQSVLLKRLDWLPRPTSITGSTATGGLIAH